MMQRKRRTRVRESFDQGHPVAGAIRSLVPPDSEMDEQARERMMVHLFAMQRRAAQNQDSREHSRLKTRLVPAVAVVVVTAILAAVLLPLLLTGNKPASSKFYASLEAPRGKVEVMAPAGKWESASAGQKLTEGSRIRTGQGAYASVVFPEGSRMRVTDGSQAALVAISKKAVEINHISGGTYHRVHKGTHYVVSKGDIAARAVGTAFSVENRSPGNLEILTVESQVEVSIGAHQPIKVTEGEMIVVSTTEGTNAVKSTVSRERLSDERLRESVESDAKEGYPTGVYEKLDVPLQNEEKPQSEPSTSETMSLDGTASITGASLEWKVPQTTGNEALILLRSEQSEPTYPDDEIARYTDTSITSARDDAVEPGKTYQYRLAALDASGSVAAYSNTVVISVPKSGPGPEAVSVGLTATAAPADGGVRLEWSVSGATQFSGFVVERTVVKAPSGSATPVGTTTTRNIDSTNVVFTLLDKAVAAGHTYTYRVGLVVDGAVMVYSAPVTVEVAKP
jgi:FecR protein